MKLLAAADHLHLKISRLALFNIKLLLKESNILHILNESNWINTVSDLSVNHHFCATLQSISM